MKQTYAAELLGVSQATISRWESGALRPTDVLESAYLRLAGAPSASDAALKRLVEDSRASVHLVCDATHTLLAASRTRAQEWGDALSAFLGRSLWRYASPEIQAMEARLGRLGWHEEESPALAFWTGANTDERMRIPPGLVLWEQLRLQDGRAARLVTACPAPPSHARMVDPEPA